MRRDPHRQVGAANGLVRRHARLVPAPAQDGGGVVTSRAQRRSMGRRRNREMKALGCTCDYTVIPIPPSFPHPPGAIAGERIAHWTPCPLALALRIGAAAGNELNLATFVEQDGCE